MRRKKQDKSEDFDPAAAAAWPYGPGDYLWHAMARLTGTHRDPVVTSGPFARPAGILSFAQASDVILASRVQLTGARTASEIHDMIATATHGISWDSRTLGPDIALDVMVGKRQDLALHKDHLRGLTRLLLDADEPSARPASHARDAAPTAVGVARAGRCGRAQHWASLRRVWASPSDAGLAQTAN
ncbi:MULTISPECIES: hypothetical protein [unclassified Streptomyces]|uniref:hypothetical protein n=1 Tax=unclassified Streptomyces TaxID=2593676 RepID=UPI002F90ADF0